MLAPRYRAFLVGALACLAALVLHGYPLLRPALFDDDFLLLLKSWTWPAAWQNLWLPHNEHALPLARVSTAALVDLAGGRLTELPLLAAWQGPLAVVLGMVLVCLFVAREMGHVFYGLAAMILFGISQKYNEAVFWYTASFMLLAVDTTLLALLAAQRWRQTEGPGQLILCAVWCGVAPCWFAGGILAGPLCALYLLPCRLRLSEVGAKSQAAMLSRAAVPLFGTAAFLALSLTFAGSKIVHAEHHGAHSTLQALSPGKGLLLTLRALVDNLVLPVYPATGQPASPVVLVVALIAFVLVGWYWWRVAVHHRLMLLGLAFIFLNYLLVYSARAEGWAYFNPGGVQMIDWSRYHLPPFLGLVFFLCGGLPSRQGTLFTLAPDGLTWRQAAALALFAVLLLAAQLPATVRGHQTTNPDPAAQAACLRRIEETDERCREHHIDAATARAALGAPLVIPQCDKPPLIDGWDLLRGSPEPRPMSVEEARRLLAPR